MAAEPYIGEVAMFGGNFAPAGWAFCDGSTISIANNSTLFAVIGTTFGGDGQTTFGLPDLRGRTPIHMGRSATSGTTYVIGQTGGVESVALTNATTPAHSHAVAGSVAMKVRADNPDTQVSPVNNGLAIAPGKKYFSRTATANAMGPLDTNIVLSQYGSSTPHENMQPFQVINFIIALVGIFPSRN